MSKWIGPGVLTVYGKDYKYGEDIPIKELSEERIAQFKKLGFIGEVPVAGPNPEILKLTRQISEAKEAQAKAELMAEHAFGKNQGLIAINRELLAKVEGLELEISKLKKDPDSSKKADTPDKVEGAAGPTGKNAKGDKDK